MVIIIDTRLIMKKNILSLILVLSVTFASSAQVGINTNSPKEALDVNGTVRINELPTVDNTENISLTGITSGNTLSRTRNGGNIVIFNNELNTAPVSRELGYLDLGLAPVDFYVNGNPQVNNLKLNIGLDGDNAEATFITMHSYSSKYLIAGIHGGTEGRRITLFFENDGKNIKMLEDSSDALPQNRILTLANSSISTAGQGFIEIVYDDDAGADGLGRWLVIKFRP